MIGSLKDGVEERELDAVEVQIGCKLPSDYCCSFRIHNRQKLVVPRLMGSMAFSNHNHSKDLLDIDPAAGGFQQRQGLKCCLPLTFCIHTGLSQYIALESVEGCNQYEIFYQCPNQMARNLPAIDMLIAGASYSKWFTSCVHNAVTGATLSSETRFSGMFMIKDVWQQLEKSQCLCARHFSQNSALFLSLTISSLTESGLRPLQMLFLRRRVIQTEDIVESPTLKVKSKRFRSLKWSERFPSSVLARCMTTPAVPYSPPHQDTWMPLISFTTRTGYSTWPFSDSVWCVPPSRSPQSQRKPAIMNVL